MTGVQGEGPLMELLCLWQPHGSWYAGCLVHGRFLLERGMHPTKAVLSDTTQQSMAG